ncbi:unnamed protein product [marine sediment metagenome]|uniref:Uncharacterized protein n=1 Tax=marine sediment metagenome TaxID=412755 RepID=X1IHE6_9ZZZZ
MPTSPSCTPPKLFPIEAALHWTGHTYLDASDNIRAYFTGGLAADSCQIYLTGYSMTLET